MTTTQVFDHTVKDVQEAMEILNKPHNRRDNLFLRVQGGYQRLLWEPCDVIGVAVRHYLERVKSRTAEPSEPPAAQPLPAGYVVGEFRPPRRGELYLATDRETMFLAVSDPRNSPILVKLPDPAAAEAREGM